MGGVGDYVESHYHCVYANEDLFIFVIYWLVLTMNFYFGLRFICFVKCTVYQLLLWFGMYSAWFKLFPIFIASNIFVIISIYAVCDGTFFPSLVKEMSEVVGCFNKRARRLLKLHLASGFRRYVNWFKHKLRRTRVAFIQEGKDLVRYAIINAIAMRKILKKYDKVCLFTLLHKYILYSDLTLLVSYIYFMCGRFITRSKGKHSSHKRKVCTLRFFNLHGYASLWLST